MPLKLMLGRVLAVEEVPLVVEGVVVMDETATTIRIRLLTVSEIGEEMTGEIAGMNQANRAYMYQREDSTAY